MYAKMAQDAHVIQHAHIYAETYILVKMYVRPHTKNVHTPPRPPKTNMNSCHNAPYVT